MLLGSFLVSSSLYSQEEDHFYRGGVDVQYTEVFSFFYEKVTHTVSLGVDSDGLPQHYYAHLITPVCDDSICEILHLELYWDLLGNYMGFDTLPGFALTKYDHVKFNAKEYRQLNEILEDAYSPLGELQMADLLNNEESHSSGVIDAVSGATNVDIANSVVQGGVYSCYILWHIAHSQTKDSLLEYTTSLLDKPLVAFMLASNAPRYQIYVLSTFTDADYLTYKSDLVPLISSDAPTVLAYLMENMPSSFLALAEVQEAMSSQFSNFSVVSRYKYLLRLAECNCILPLSLEILSTQIETMSYMQVQEFADLLKRSKGAFTEETLRNVQHIISATSYKYAFVLEEVLLHLR